MRRYKVIQAQLVTKVEITEIMVRARSPQQALHNARTGEHVISSESTHSLDGSETFGAHGFGVGIDAEDDAVQEMEESDQ